MPVKIESELVYALANAKDDTANLVLFNYVPYVDEEGLGYLKGELRYPANNAWKGFCEVYKEDHPLYDGASVYICVIAKVDYAIPANESFETETRKFSKMKDLLWFVDERAFDAIECTICQLEALQDRRSDLYQKLRERP